MDLISLRISGSFACFTRPEHKAERVSYDVITPTAARGILDSILWRPAIRWHVTRITILRPIRFQSVRRNELKGVLTLRDLRGKSPLVCIEDERIQRSSLVLKDVAYRIDAYCQLTDRAGPNDNISKFVAMFERRLRRGQCFAQPYLGCREFSANFEEAIPGEVPIDQSLDLGWMLHDIDYAEAEPRALYFRATMERGVIQVPETAALPDAV